MNQKVKEKNYAKEMKKLYYIKRKKLHIKDEEDGI